MADDLSVNRRRHRWSHFSHFTLSARTPRRIRLMVVNKPAALSTQLMRRCECGRSEASLKQAFGQVFDDRLGATEHRRERRRDSLGSIDAPRNQSTMTWTLREF